MYNISHLTLQLHSILIVIVISLLNVVCFYNSSGWRRKLIFDIYVLAVVSTEAASDMARCLNTNWAFVLLISWPAVSKQEDSDHPADDRFDGHGFMVNVLVGLSVLLLPPK